MNVDRFKVWFEGFADAVEYQPTVEQWAQLVKHVGELSREDSERSYQFEKILQAQGPVVADGRNLKVKSTEQRWNPICDDWGHHKESKEPK